MCRKLRKKGGWMGSSWGNTDTGMRPEIGNSLAQAVSCQQCGFNPWLLNGGSVVDIVALGWVFSNTSVSPANSHSTDCFISLINHLELVQWPIYSLSTKGMLLLLVWSGTNDRKTPHWSRPWHSMCALDWEDAWKCTIEIPHTVLLLAWLQISKIMNM
jgi:hypothetical protein